MRCGRLKAAVVGLGVGAHHAISIMKNPSCILSRIVDLSESKIKEFLKKYSLSRELVSSFDQVMEDSGINLISIASFDDSHYSQIMASIAAGKNIFVEKPLCQTRDQLLKIYQAFLKRPFGIASNLVLRTADLYRKIKDLIESNRLGEIYSFEGDYLYGRLHKITKGWRRNVSNYSVMAGGGIHMIDLMIWLIGQKPIEVSSQVNKIATANSDFRYPDFQNSIFSFKNGIIARITANFGCVHRHQHVVKIFGTKGTFIYDDMGARIHWSRNKTKDPEFLDDAPLPRKKTFLIDEFIHHISEKNYIWLAQREFDLMSAVLAADEAVHSRQQIKIEYLKC